METTETEYNECYYGNDKDRIQRVLLWKQQRENTTGVTMETTETEYNECYYGNDRENTTSVTMETIKGETIVTNWTFTPPVFSTFVGVGYQGEGQIFRASKLKACWKIERRNFSRHRI